ncbi:MAG: polyribonucleotide nucleotidyltransferase, partial [Muribaculaceae bacterium]|nr:polyribonucleotide nucleotidyltransferase [Muribaculaceae bacterium]
VYAIAKAGSADKHWRIDSFAAVCQEYIDALPEEERDEKTPLVKRYYHDVEKEAMRRCVLDEGIRLDGRKTTEIRPIWCEVDYIPGPHGSAVFTRGETQSLATVTLGTKLDEKILDDVLNQGRERFLLHYNFPPFSTGEARPVRGVGRREIGHGNLAHRALKRMFPDNFPYVCRIVSDILESNGSSSMATVCAGTLALLDAGVKMKRPVAGIAMGLISDGTKYAILSDILGDEDHLGDMDFKVTGTRDGITATQMDIKCDGLSYEILEKALNQARDGRLHILDIIEQTIPASREDYKPHVPRIVTMLIPKELIGAVIGPGGKVIQGIQEASGATVSIDEIDEGGYIEVAASNKAAIDKALELINRIVELPEEGKVYHGTVRSVMEFGAFVEFMPNRDGLLHISEISWDRLPDMEASGLKEGDKVDVKLIEIDKKTGKYRLSMRALTPKPDGYVEPQRAPRGERPRREGADRGPRRDRGDRGPRRNDR